MSRPRTSRRADSGSPSSGVPSKVTEPSTVALSGSSRVSAIAVTLLPQPDSPTRASTSRGATSNDAASTASTGPSSVRNRTVNSRTDSSPSAGGGTSSTAVTAAPPPASGPRPSPPALLRVEGVAQAVADQVEREGEQDDRHAREDRHPRAVAEERLGAGEHDAQRRCRRPGAEPQERQHPPPHAPHRGRPGG